MAEEIAEVIEDDPIETLLAQGVDAAEQLDVATGLAQLQKGDLALHALGHNAAGDGDRILGWIWS